MPKITTIGGGTGSPTIIAALIAAGFNDINAISASTDSGGKTGIIRSDERDRVIAVSDLLRNMLSLIPPSSKETCQVKAFFEMLAYTDGRNRNLGYTIYYALLEKYEGDHQQVQKHIENLLDMKFEGRAIPVTNTPANIVVKTISGDTFVGEHELDRLSMSKNEVESFWLEPTVKAEKLALKAIQNADFIFICPGSLYGSILANFLPKGVKTAYKNSRAKKILITNLVSDRNQTHRFTASSYNDIFKNLTGLKKPIDIFITPHITRSTFNEQFPKTAGRYALEHSIFLGKNAKAKAKLEEDGVAVLEADVFTVTERLNRIRHSPQKLSQVFQKIILS